MFSLLHTSIGVIALEMPSDESIYERFSRFYVEDLEQRTAIVCNSADRFDEIKTSSWNFNV